MGITATISEIGEVRTKMRQALSGIHERMTELEKGIAEVLRAGLADVRTTVENCSDEGRPGRRGGPAGGSGHVEAGGGGVRVGSLPAFGRYDSTLLQEVPSRFSDA